VSGREESEFLLSGRAIDAYYARAGSARLDGDAEILNSRLALSCLRRINRQRSRSALDPLGSPVFRDNSFGAPLRKIAVRFFSTMSFRATRRFPARRARRTCRFFPPPHSRSLDSAFSTFLFQRLLSLSLSLPPPGGALHNIGDDFAIISSPGTPRKRSLAHT